MICSVWSDSSFAITLDLIILFLQLCAKDLEDKSVESVKVAAFRGVLILKVVLAWSFPRLFPLPMQAAFLCQQPERLQEEGSKQCKQLCTFFERSALWEHDSYMCLRGKAANGTLESHSKHAVYN